MKSAASKSARRAPNGVVSEKPVVMRLTAAERARVERIAEREVRSLGAQSRLLLLRGLDACEQGEQPRAA